MLTIAAIGLLALAAAADVYFTKRVLEQGGREVGPLMGPVLERFGFAGLVAVKAGLTLFVGAAAFNAGGLFGAGLALAGAAVWGFFAWHNWRQAAG